MRLWTVVLSMGLVCGVPAGGVALAQMPEGMGGPGSGGPGTFAGGQMVRGTITAVAGTTITVKTDAGDVYQVAVSANTRLMKARQPLKLSEVKAGDALGAMGVLDAPTKTVHAVFVTVVDAEEVKKAREGLGKVFIVGKVTAIDEVKLTVLRSDNVNQVIEVDESTSFKKGGRGVAVMMNGGVMNLGAGGGRPSGGGESITLADVKVGDMVAGQGGLKHGIFVPTELNVMDPAAMGQRRRRQNTEGGAAGGAAVPATPSAPQTP